MPSTSDLADPQEYQKIFHWAETQKNGTIPSFATRRNDPYKVCVSIKSMCSQLLTTASCSTKLALAMRMSPASSDSTG
jgi:hypothetical protein